MPATKEEIKKYEDQIKEYQKQLEEMKKQTLESEEQLKKFSEEINNEPDEEKKKDMRKQEEVLQQNDRQIKENLTKLEQALADLEKTLKEEQENLKKAEEEAQRQLAEKEIDLETVNDTSTTTPPEEEEEEKQTETPVVTSMSQGQTKQDPETAKKLKDDLKDIINDYNAISNKKKVEVPKGNEEVKLQFDTEADAKAFFQDQAGKNRSFIAENRHPDGTKLGTYYISFGDGQFYEGSLEKILGEIPEGANRDIIERLQKSQEKPQENTTQQFKDTAKTIREQNEQNAQADEEESSTQTTTPTNP